MDSLEFKRRMSQLPEPVTDKQPPFWEFWRHQLWRLGQVDDPYKFELWPCVYHTMLQNHWPNSIRYELSQLPSELVDECAATDVPNDILPNTTISLSMNLIHQAYHLHQWQQATGRRIDHLDTIVEFGGGYGAMCLLCHRLGFKGRYVIYDLPEFSLLQEWYLSQFDRLANVEWNPKRKPKDVDLFMALYSLSEVPMIDRNNYLLNSKSYLFLYSGNWENYKNVPYFQGVIQNSPSINLQWRHSELTHLPDRNNWYSIGW